MSEFRKVLENVLTSLMEKDEKICVLDADLAKPNGTYPLYKKFPNRTFDVGIQEANMASIAAGLAASGFKPIIVTFTPFATRRICDQIAVSICYAQQNVKIIGTDPGITAELNGGTHMSFEDIGVMRSIPKMAIYDATDDIEFEKALPQIMAYDGPMYIRMPRKSRPTVNCPSLNYQLFKAYNLNSGKDISIFASGVLVYEALIASKMLKEDGINADVVVTSTIKPLDEKSIIASLMKTNLAIVCDNHNIYGGLFSAISEVACKNYPTKIMPIGINDEFGQVGKYDELLKAYSLTANDIYVLAKKMLDK